MFVALWEFKVKSGVESEFERVYGSGGDWAQLFRKDATYRGTRLAKDVDCAGWYFTIDTWDSCAAYESFRRANEAAYAALDARCENLTSEENEIGSFNS